MAPLAALAGVALPPELVRALATDLGAVLGLVLLAAVWLLIQRAWRHAFPEHASADEARDVRWGSCGAGCGCAAGSCRREVTAEDPFPSPARSDSSGPPAPETPR